MADDGQGAYLRNSDETKTKPVFTAELLKKTFLNPKTGHMSHPKVVSGAYTLTAYDAKKQEIRLEINPHFVGDSEGRKPTIEKLTYKGVSQDTKLRERWHESRKWKIGI